MPFSLNGCGTRFYGRRDPGQDGSYITTEWITFFYVPIVPIRSCRVLPVGSQQYQSVPVPLCWAQVRNALLVVIPIILLVVVYFNWSDIQGWFKEGGKPSHSSLQVEPQQAQPVEEDLPLDSKAASVACGKVLKLDEAGFVKLNIVARISQVIADSGISDEELKEFSPGNGKDWEDQVSSVYGLAYLSWDKSAQFSRADLDKDITKFVASEDMKSLSPDEQNQIEAFFAKLRVAMLKAFDLGRHDAKLSPCPY